MNTCDVCGTTAPVDTHPCRFERGCSCFRSQPCEKPHTVRGETSDDGWPYGTTHDADCPRRLRQGPRAMSDCPAHTDKTHRYETRCVCGMKGTVVLSIVAEDERVYISSEDPAQQERERLRYELGAITTYPSKEWGGDGYAASDIHRLLADPEDDR